MEKVIEFQGWRSKAEARLHTLRLQANTEMFLAEVWRQMDAEVRANRDQIHAVPPVKPRYQGLDKVRPPLPGIDEYLAIRRAHRNDVPPAPPEFVDDRSLADLKIDLSDVDITLG